MLMIIAPVMVEVGQVRHSSPSSSRTQSPGGLWLSITTSAKSISFFPEEWAGAELSQCSRDDGNHRHATPLRTHGHFHHHRANAAGGDHDKRVMGAEVEALEDLFRVPFVLLQIQRRPEAVRAHDVGVR